MKPLKSQADIARKFQVSQMTVSRALNDSPRVSEKLRTKIQEYAEQHGFTSNRLASGLGKGSTRIIGLLLPDMTFSFYPEITDGIEETLRAEGYCPIIHHTRDSAQQMEDGIRLLMGFRTEGLIVAPAGQKNIGLFQQLVSKGIPFVRVAVKCNRVSVAVKSYLLTACRLRRQFPEFQNARSHISDHRLVCTQLEL
jgi:LacI family transcriptional regulator